MRYDLLTPGVNAYKANLHCHTTMSDGRLTPEEIKAHYQAHGYSIVAFTDHEKITVNSSGRAAGVRLAGAGESLVAAEIPLRDDMYDYIRVTVEDDSGAKAWSNAVFRDQIGLG